MADWKQAFDSLSIQKGRVIYGNHKVKVTKQTEGRIEAEVSGQQWLQVSITLKDGVPVNCWCKCPKALGGRKCEHAAAALFAVYGDEEAASKKPEEESALRAVREQTILKKRAEQGREDTAELQYVQEELNFDLEEPWSNKEEKQGKQEAKGQDSPGETKEEQEEARRSGEQQEAKGQNSSGETREEPKKRRRSRAVQQEAKGQDSPRETKEEQEEARRSGEQREAKGQDSLGKTEEEQEARRRSEAEELRRKQKNEERAERKRKKYEAEEQARKARQEEALRAREEKERTAMERELKKEQEKRAREVKSARQAEMQERQEGSSYFDGRGIYRSLKATPQTEEKARQLIQQKAVEMGEFSTGYLSDKSFMVGQQQAVGIEKGNRFGVVVTFGPDKVLHTECGCSSCRPHWYWEQKNCSYVTAVAMQVREYLSGHDVGDSTDRNGMNLMNRFRKKQANQTVTKALSRTESMSLEPKLVRNEDGLEVTFRYGAERKYVLKELGAFCGHVQREETAKYGSKTELPHGEDVLDAEGRKWYFFIWRIVQEDRKAAERQLRKSSPWDYYSAKSLKFPSLDLTGGRLDQFYELIRDAAIEYEDKTNYEKNKRLLHCAEEAPHIRMQLSPLLKGAKKSFQGLNVQCDMPELYEGQEAVYFIKGDRFCRSGMETLNKVKPLMEYSWDGNPSFIIGKKNLSEFYYSVLPTFADALELVETDPDTIQANLPPQVEFVFYLDAPGNALTCRIEARYGERKVSCLDYCREDVNTEALPAFRMEGREREVLYRTMLLFPEVDLEQEELKCERHEDTIYEILSHGLDALAEMGEIQCTDRFNRLNILKKLTVSVGVSVSQGLLNLEIASTDVSREELLEILKSYRVHKKFHRLRNGDFLNLEDDENLAMLAEMMGTMRLSPKEFVKGKMQLPLYRTLYLDKMLESNAGIYSERDSYFRNLVKEFKTVNDADYEEPKTLQRTMRNYQRTGYKWLRVLASRHFGGILADEMGLGKTLQMIAVLLAAKNDGTAGVSLVVCPAALVYNWVEEFARFAPDLTVQAVTGTQEARREKIAEASRYDVLVTSYDLLKRDIDQYEDTSFLYEVIDEAQYIKNHTTAAAKAVKVVKSEHRFALTGTPIENSLSELWSIFDYLMPGFLYGYDIFRREFELPVVKYSDEDAMKRLQRMAGPFILRRCKEEVLKDLPEKMEENRYVQLEDEQRKLYDAQVVHMQTMLAGQNNEEFSKNKLKVLAELTKLRQICCDPSLCFEKYQGESAKLDSCMELIDSAIDGGHRMLVFSQFTSMIAILQESLTQRGVEFYTITGSTPKEKRLQLVKSFNEGSTPVFLISLRAGGVGLNLTGADMVIHYDPWWNLAVQNQATDRAHRIGQTKKVTVYKLIVRKSIEEKIQKLQETKRGLAEQILDAEAADIGSMTKEELLELLEG